jgi:hypothetical protein
MNATPTPDDVAPAHFERSRTTLVLWFGVLGPIVIWKARLWAGYALVPYACAWQSTVALNGVTLLALLLVALAGTGAWRSWRRAGRGRELERDGTVTRGRFLAVLGMLSSAFFFLVIVAEGVANIIIDPCI